MTGFSIIRRGQDGSTWYFSFKRCNKETLKTLVDPSRSKGNHEEKL